MEGNKGEKKWDNSNSIINKIFFKKIFKNFCKPHRFTLPLNNSSSLIHYKSI